MERVTILGVPVDALTREQLHTRLGQFVRTNAHALVLHANVHGINLAQEQPWLRTLYQQADLVFCDGAGVMLGARILGYTIPERITYADWIWELAAWASACGYTLFLLGAAPGVAEQACASLVQRYPTLRIVGTQHGYFDKTPGSAENMAVLDTINQASPDLLLVCFGMPLQEQWLAANWDALSVKVALTGGAALDYASGRLRRGPQQLTSNGWEWLARLIIEPRRLWRRYLVGNPLFIGRVLRQRLALRKSA